MSETGDVFRAVVKSAPPVGIIATATTIVLICVTYVLAPQIEGFFFPVFASNVIPAASVTRTGDRLCWTRVGEKARDLPLIDIDADVDYISNITGKLAHQPTPEILDAESGEPITTDDALPSGKAFELRRCLRLSPHILPGQPVRLRQIAYYQSPTGLYNIPVTVPTIVLPADQAWVFSQRHDTAPTPKGGTDAVAGPPPESRRALPAGPQDIVRSPDDYMRRQAEPRPRHATVDREVVQGIDEPDPSAQRGPAALSARVDIYLTPEMKARLKQYGDAHALRGLSPAARELIGKGLDADDRDALGPYDPGKK